MATKFELSNQAFNNEVEGIVTVGLPTFLKDRIDTVKNNKPLFEVVGNFEAVRLIAVIFTKIYSRIECKDPWSNSVDPIGFIIGASLNGVASLQEYSEKERERQQGKTIDNYIGYFHQGLLRLAFGDSRDLNKLFDNTKEMPLDVLHSDAKVGAEVKNKWNTTKGNTRNGLYQKLSEAGGVVDGKKYYAEILDKPGKNAPTTIPFEQYEGVEQCNGAYIYGEAAKLKGLVVNGNILRKVLENFPVLVWLYCKIFINYSFPQYLPKVKQDLLELKQKVDEYIEVTKEISAPRLKLLQSIKEIQTETSSLPEIEDFVESIENCTARGEPFKSFKEQALQGLGDLIILHQGISKTQMLNSSIETFLQEGEENHGFFQDKLIGHLFSN